MGFTVALDLRDLIERFPANPRLGVGLVDGFTGEGLLRKHQAVAPVAVVSEGQHLSPGLFLIGSHVPPEVLRIEAVKLGIGYHLIRPVGVVPKDDHTMEVIPLRY